MQRISRRDVLAAAAAGAVVSAPSTTSAQTFGNPDLPPQGAINTTDNPASATDPGPQNPALASQFPDAFSPPPTAVGDMPMFWASFNNAPRRIQNGGWARQVTQSDFQIAEEISGVNMRLARGGIRELHWHQAAEWAYVSRGAVRVTTIDTEGRANVEDIGEGGLWYFPSGLPHSLQGIGEDGSEFILAFDNGRQSEYNTLLLSDWLAHTPPDILALNFGVPADTFAKIPLHQLYIFPGQMPGSLAAAQAQAQGAAGRMPNPSTFALSSMPPTRKTAGGEVRIADSRNFKASQHRRRAGTRVSGWPARDALASQRGRMAILRRRRGDHDRVQYRAQGGDSEFQARRHRLREEIARPLHQEYRQHGPGVPRDFPKRPFRRCLALRLAGAYAARDGRTAPQRRPRHHRTLSQQQARNHAGIDARRRARVSRPIPRKPLSRPRGSNAGRRHWLRSKEEISAIVMCNTPAA